MPLLYLALIQAGVRTFNLGLPGVPSQLEVLVRDILVLLQHRVLTQHLVLGVHLLVDVVDDRSVAFSDLGGGLLLQLLSLQELVTGTLLGRISVHGARLDAVVAEVDVQDFVS